MGKYLKLFETHNEYETELSSLALPNVSFCLDRINEVHYNPYVEPIETKLVCVYSVDNEEVDSDISLMHSSYSNDVFESMEVDGVELTAISTTYRFETAGNHTVKYTLTDPTIIGNGTFYGCLNLISVTIPSSVTSIDSSAFYECYNLASIDIPTSVTYIGGSAFYSTAWIDSYSSDPSNVYGNIVYINDIALKAVNTEITSVTFKENTIEIYASAFESCTGLTSIVIPDSVTSIEYSAFEYCSNITSVTISDSVTSIGNYVFNQCTDLISVTIGNGVTSIGDGVFHSCSSLETITSNATIAPTISASTFSEVKSNGTLYVPTVSTGYNIWMGTGDSYLGKYNWTKVEQ